AVWVAGTGATVLRIDPATNKIIATVPVSTSPMAITIDPATQTPWVATFGDYSVVPVVSGTVVAIDPSTNQPTRTFKLVLPQNGTTGVAVGAGSVWVAANTTVIRFDQATGRITNRFE